MSTHLQDIATIALAHTEEVGGYISKTGDEHQVYLIKNVSLDPVNSYVPCIPIPPDVTFWHSHQNGSSFSRTDIIGIWHTPYPWLLFDKATLSFTHFDKNHRRPYLGRNWEKGLSDCYCLIRDWYRFELHIKLPDPTIYMKGDDQQNSYDLGIVLNNNFQPTDVGQAHDLVIWKDAQEIKHLGVLLNVDHQYVVLHHPRHQPSQLITNLEQIKGCKFYRSRHSLPSYSQETWGTSLSVSMNFKQIDLMKLSPTVSTKSPTFNR